MLATLKVTNFALFENACCNFSAGLNVLSGETGSGKSIFMEALNAALGGKVSADYIRSGSKSFEIEAVFDAVCTETQRWIADNGIAAGDGIVIVRRYFAGRSEQSINGTKVNLQQLRQLSQSLVDIHGQHDHQALLRDSTHLDLLDLFEPETVPALSRWQQQFAEYRKLQARLARLEEQAKNAAQRCDILGWQLKEIDAARLKKGEDDELEELGKKLANAEKIAAATSECHALLDGSGKETGVIDKLYSVQREIDYLSRFYSDFGNYRDGVTQALLVCQDLREAAADLGSNTEYNPAKLDACYTRLEEIKRLKRKYGETIEEIIRYRDEAAQELGDIENADYLIEQCRENLADAEKELLVTGKELSGIRLQAAQTFAEAMADELAGLSLPGARLQVELLQSGGYSEKGLESAEIMFSANIGEPVKPLNKVASGGELSRIALALKNRINQNGDAQTLVFDEIDSGVGGKTALTVAGKLAGIARRRQVLCISHLPQVATIAGAQYLFEKCVSGERTSSSIRLLDKEERIVEIARMLGGTVNEKSVEMAKDLLNRKEEI